MTTIIMPVYNRPEHTKQSIETLYENTKDIFILIVVDDCSDTATSSLLHGLQEKFNFHLHRNDKNKGVGASKNIGYKVADRTEFIYFSDNDVYFLPDWLRITRDIYSRVKNRVKLLGASCHPYLKDNENIGLGNYRVGLKDAVSGYSHFMEWETFTTHGLYDEFDGDGKKTGRSEDWALCQRIKKAGFEVGSIYPEIIIPTGKTDSYGELSVGHETYTNKGGVNVI